MNEQIKKLFQKGYKLSMHDCLTLGGGGRKRGGGRKIRNKSNSLGFQTLDISVTLDYATRPSFPQPRSFFFLLDHCALLSTNKENNFLPQPNFFRFI